LVGVGEDRGRGEVGGRCSAEYIRECCTQVPLVDDQHAVGEFGSDCAHESFGKTVRPRAMWWNPDHADSTTSAKTVSNDAVNWSPGRGRETRN
jgi:hypothetical protein